VKYNSELSVEMPKRHGIRYGLTLQWFRFKLALQFTGIANFVLQMLVIYKVFNIQSKWLMVGIVFVGFLVALLIGTLYDMLGIMKTEVLIHNERNETMLKILDQTREK